MSKCPVDHSPKQECPVDQSSSSSSTWSRLFSSSPSTSQPQSKRLSTNRQISSIPRHPSNDTDNKLDSNWVYPSESQFFDAMARKNHNPQTADMKTIVPIHNAVNERAWAHILDWENGRGGDKCGGVKLVSFMGKPKQMSPKARLKTFIGYTAPFDRHDWIVDRCGIRTRYIIDFYTGKNALNAGPSFYIDARPALDSWEGVKMRTERFWSQLLSRFSDSTKTQ